MNHKLELALHDAVSSVKMVSQLRMFMNTLYAYYSRSPEHCRQLDAVSAVLGSELRKIGKIFDVMWLSLSYQTVDAIFLGKVIILSTCCALLGSAEIAATSKDHAKAQGMAKNAILAICCRRSTHERSFGLSENSVFVYAVSISFNNGG